MLIFLDILPSFCNSNNTCGTLSLQSLDTFIDDSIISEVDNELYSLRSDSMIFFVLEKLVELILCTKNDILNLINSMCPILNHFIIY